MKKDYRDRISYGFIGVIYIFAILKTTLDPMHVPITAWHMLLFALGAFLFYTLLDTRAGRIVFLSGAAIGIGYLGFVTYKVIQNGVSVSADFFAPVTHLIHVMIQIGTGYYNETVPANWLIYAIGVYALLIAAPIYYFLVKVFRFVFLIIPGLLFFMTVYGINRYVDKFSFFIFIVVAVVTYILHVFIRNERREGYRGESASGRRILTGFIPPAAIVVLIAFSIPVDPMPIQWPWMDQKINKLWWDIHHQVSVDRYDTFSLAHTGFGGSGRLGGPVRPDDTLVLRVEAPTRLYLRGAVYDTYDGKGWDISDQEQADFSEDRILDHLELFFGWKAESIRAVFEQTGVRPSSYADRWLYGLNGLMTPEEHLAFLSATVSLPDNKMPAEEAAKQLKEYAQFLEERQLPEEISRLYLKKELKISHMKLRTKTVFTPLKLFLPISRLSSAGYEISEGFGGVFQANRRLAGGMSYDIDYLQPGYGMRQLEALFEKSRPGLYSEFIEYHTSFFDVLDFKRIQDKDALLQEFEASLEIYQQLQRHRDSIYTQYTRLPEGIPMRVYELAYDISSAGVSTYERIKLLEHYLRDNFSYTLTPQYPPEDQDFIDYFLFEGKEGYCTYYASALCIMARMIGIPTRYVEGFILPEKAEDTGEYLVTNRNAHAWVEGYLEGIGWIPFEPTAPYGGVMNYHISLAEIQAGQDYMDDPMQDIDEEDDSDTPGTGEGIEWFDAGEEEKQYNRVWLGLLAALVILFLANRLFVLGRTGIFKLLPQRISVPAVYRRLIFLLGQTGCSIHTGETAKDFAKRVDERYIFVHLRMTDMAEMFYRVRYGGHTLNKPDIKRLFRFMREVRIQTGRNLYLFNRIATRGFLFRG